MPWQSAPALGIIGGAFFVTGLGLVGVDYLAYGRPRRVQIDEFIFRMDRRTAYMKSEAKRAEAIEAGKKVSPEPPQAKYFH